MAILGLLLVAAAVAIGVETALSNQSDVTIEVFERSYTMPVSEVFLVGAACGLVAMLGLWMVVGTLGRSRRRRADAKHRTRTEDTRTQLSEVGQTNAELVAENDQLREELAAERRAAATMGGVAVPPGTGNVPYGDQVSDAVRSDTISGTGHFDPYPTDHGTDATVNTEAGRTASDADTHADVTGRMRGIR